MCNSISVFSQLRSELKVAPDKVFSAMIKYAEKEDSVNLIKSMKHIDPLLIRFQQQYDRDFKLIIKEDLKEGSSSDVLIVINDLIYTDIIDILNGVKNGEIETNKGVWIKIAYKDYVLISPYVVSVDNGFEQDRLLKNNFHKLMSIHSSESGYLSNGENSNINSDLLTIMIELLRKCMS
ncbi:MAG: hypothetical protein COA49_03415 [Bacteroidetes bacterium]|nr:MAG: hypothetical protein COA49_03415 [Bacteroidota bacterium]